MDPKPRPNHELSHELLRVGVRQRFPDAGEDEVQRIYLERLIRCQNRAS
jgi:hypothetical protein